MSTPFPDFSTITFLQPGLRSSNAGVQTDLSKLFNAIVNSEKLEIDEYDFERIFCADLTIDTKKLDKQLIGVLGEALLYYMTVWPGWRRNNEYFTGVLQFKEWFERFRQYLIFKSNFLIKMGARFSENVVIHTTDAAIQTDADNSSSKKSIAPYTLVVGGPPAVLNNVVFLENKGNILVKQHLEKPWQTLTMKEIINWPHVSVEVKLPDIGISRTNAHGCQRFIALSSDFTDFPEINNIMHINRTAEAGNSELQPYTYEFIECYIKQLYQTISQIPEISSVRYLELLTVFTEFLSDIKEVSLYNNTMCPNISVGYHIGKCRYIRNKKMVSTNTQKKSTEQNVINFYEIIVPQINFTLHYFKAVQDLKDKNAVTFQSLSRILHKMSVDNVDKTQQEIENLKFLINNTCVIYNCTLCLKNFSGPHAHFNLTKHFSQHHKAEQSVLCNKCRHQFDVQMLAGNRWAHDCI